MKDEFFGIDLSALPVQAKQSGSECDLPVMVYLQMQQLCSVYQPEQALTQGTLFPELDKPFMMGGLARG